MPLRNDFYSDYNKTWYRWVGLDAPAELPKADQAVDMVGVPLKVGDHVCWHIGGRHGSGHVFGTVETISEEGTWEPIQESREDKKAGEYITTTTGFNARHTVTVAPLKKGRKGVTRGSQQLLHYVTPEMAAALTIVHNVT